MASVGFGGFINKCAHQEVELKPEITDFEIVHDIFLPFTYAPNEMLKAVAVAGILLRRGYKDLANKPIKPDGELSRNTVAMTLTNIINGSIEPLDAAVDLPASPSGIDACRAADFKFLTLIDALQKGEGKCQIIGDNEAALIRKTRNGQPSALSVRDLVVDGIPFPAGSMFNIELTDEDKTSIQTPNVLESVGLNRVEGLGFMRLSVFALEGIERAKNFKDLDLDRPLASASMRTLGDYSISDIRNITEQAYLDAVPVEELIGNP